MGTQIWQPQEFLLGVSGSCFGHLCPGAFIGEHPPPPPPQVHCRAQILEVYNEKLRDLLNDASAKAPEIHVHPRVGVYVDGAVDAPVDTLEQLQTLLDTGLARASVAATARNSKSSRGHVVFRLLVENHEEDHTVVSSELFCVDLAGRENEKTTKVTGENFIELTFINRSLMWLAQCIQTLGRQARKKSNSKAPDSGSSGSYIPPGNSFKIFVYKPKRNIESVFLN